jgi:hypothetical protein
MHKCVHVREKNIYISWSIGFNPILYMQVRQRECLRSSRLLKEKRSLFFIDQQYYVCFKSPLRLFFSLNKYLKLFDLVQSTPSVKILLLIRNANHISLNFLISRFTLVSRFTQLSSSGKRPLLFSIRMLLSCCAYHCLRQWSLACSDGISSM